VPRIYRRLAIAGMVILGGWCFSQVAPVVAALFLLPTGGPSLSDPQADMVNRLNSIHDAGTLMTTLWLVGMAAAAIGVMYGLLALAFTSERTTAAPSRPPSPSSAAA